METARVDLRMRVPRRASGVRLGLWAVGGQFGQGDGQIYTIRGCFEMPAFGPAGPRVHGLGEGSRRQACVCWF